MSGICGWVGAGHDPGDLQAMAGKLTTGSECNLNTITGKDACLALTSQSMSAVLWHDDELCVAVEGHPRWRDERMGRMSPRDFAKRFAAAFRQHGPKALDDVHGHFAVVLVRKDGKEALLATDRVGSRPLKYTLSDKTLLFASSADAINMALPAAREIDPQAIFNYVYFEMVPAPGTAYCDIHRLLPGQYLHFHDGRIKKELYWTADYLHAERRSHNDLEAELFNLLEASVSSSLSGKKPGAFLSGGIDSSTITGMLGKVTGTPAHSYSIGFDAPGYDEMGYARIAARHFGTDHHEYYVTPQDVVRAAPQVAAAYDAPFGNASAIPSLYCARLAKDDGVDQLLGGDGGDELFGGNSRYAKQWIFSLYEHVPHLVRRGIIEPALASSLGEYIFPGKLKSYVRQASTPMPERTESYNLVSRLGPQRIFTDEFLATVDPTRPLAMISEAYHDAKARNFLERMLATDLRFTLADNDLPKVCGMCDLAGVGISFPFLDDRMLSFAQRLPADQKVRRTYLRYFFKRAIKTFLPPEIIAKKKHGFGLPFGVWLNTDPGLQSLARDSLTSLNQRNIIRPAFIDELLSDRLEEHAAYYGTMAWILMMLELWLQSRDI